MKGVITKNGTRRWKGELKKTRMYIRREREGDKRVRRGEAGKN